MGGRGSPILSDSREEERGNCQALHGPFAHRRPWAGAMWSCLISVAAVSRWSPILSFFLSNMLGLGLTNFKFIHFNINNVQRDTQHAVFYNWRKCLEIGSELPLSNGQSSVTQSRLDYVQGFAVPTGRSKPAR